jgi:Domain of unknown function (DUF4350)
MRGRFSIFIFVAAVVLLLVGLNAASYVRVGREPELEAAPDRSTSNAGPTGTRALYDFLSESGHRVARWREEPSALLTANSASAPATFVVVGRVRRPFTPDERRSLLEWVGQGGRLVVIDRDAADLLPSGERWGLTFGEFRSPPFDLRADDAQALTAGVSAIAPAQPTLLTRAVEHVAPSRFASRVQPSGTGTPAGRGVPARSGEDEEDGPPAPAGVGMGVPSDEDPSGDAVGGSNDDTTGKSNDDAIDESDDDAVDESDDNSAEESNDNAGRGAGASARIGTGRDARGGSGENSRGRSGAGARGASSDDAGEEFYEDEPTPSPTAPMPTPTPSETPPPVPVFGRRGGGAVAVRIHGTAAPVVHLSDGRGALLAEYRRGQGSIVVLTDPFIVANNGIGRADNLQLALNVLTAREGLVVFDEYHQGRGTTHAQLLAYFAGTPVVAIAGQAAFLVALLFWSRGRRFARPLPAPRVDRRSKLEFVASMAELQQRARAFDLAIENIYSRTRRALARYGGADVSAPRAEVAAAVAARSGIDRARLEALMRECEEVSNGAGVSPRRALSLAAQLRELERALGIRMRAREIKQAGRL